MKKVLSFLVVLSSLVAAIGLTSPPPSTIGLSSTLSYFRSASAQFYSSAEHLELTLHLIRAENPQSIINARQALVNCRLKYKRIEFFLEYFFRSAALIYNSPAKFEVEEPFMEYEEPRGMQVIESILFEKEPANNIVQLDQQAKAISSSAIDVNSLLYQFNADDKQILESLRIELIRIITLSIAGYDAPLLKSGILESREALSSLSCVLQPYLNKKSRESDSTTFFLKKSISLLASNPDFDSFDRLQFLIGAALPLEHHLNVLISEMNMDLNTTGTLNYQADNLFSRDAIDPGYFSGSKLKPGPFVTALGKRLFFEKALSGNRSRSCSTCHQPGKYFTDNLSKSIAYDNKSTLKRNAPTLLYSAFQSFQFWDGRAKNLEEQVINVLHNPDEMNADDQTVLQRLETSSDYVKFFRKAFHLEKNKSISIEQLSGSIASYLRSLAPMNADFDRYILGDSKALNSSQIRGFNLFMGKAICGTCHFAPFFNGLRPPLYNTSEIEVIGVPLTDNFDHILYDSDRGRFDIFPISFYKGAFKTPTVRNISMTKPYMHNGAFPTLEKVLDFYNRGGGEGLGMQVPTQTLPSTPLHLTDLELKDIISFLGALTDSLPK